MTHGMQECHNGCYTFFPVTVSKCLQKETYCIYRKTPIFKMKKLLVCALLLRRRRQAKRRNTGSTCNTDIACYGTLLKHTPLHNYYTFYLAHSLSLSLSLPPSK